MFGLITEAKCKQLLTERNRANNKLLEAVQQKWKDKYVEAVTDFSTRELIMGWKGSGKTTFVKEAIIKHHPHHIIFSDINEYGASRQEFNWWHLEEFKNKKLMAEHIQEEWIDKRKLLVIDGFESVINVKAVADVISNALININNRPVNFVFVVNNHDAFIPKNLKARITEACNYRCYYFTGKHDNFEPTVRKIQPPHHTTSAPNFQLF